MDIIKKQTFHFTNEIVKDIGFDKKMKITYVQYGFI